MLEIGRIKISGGFLLLLALLFYFDDQWLLARALPACVAHEGGHWAMIRMMGGEIQELRLTVVGAELRLDRRYALSYTGEILSTAAGPAVNFLLAFLSAGIAPIFSGINLILGVFNLLPVLPLDGGRLLYHLSAWLRSEEEAAQLCNGLSLAVSVSLAAVGGWILWRSSYNFTLLLIAGWLFFLFINGKKGCQPGKKWLK